jgi:hypothetical protein
MLKELIFQGKLIQRRPGLLSIVTRSQATAAIAADKLMRIRSNRCLWSTPLAYSGRGRPKIHGQQFRPGDFRGRQGVYKAC